MALPTLTEAMVREGATAETFRRGQEYERQGAVGTILRRGDLLQAEVEGSDVYPYTVSIRTDAAGLIEAGCTCPYEWGGWCKHIVAVLLALIDAPDAVEERPSLDALLAEVDANRLRGLIHRLVETRQVATETIEGLLARVEPAPTSPGKPAAMPEPAPARNVAAAVRAARRDVRDEVHGLDHLRPSEAYWQVGGVVHGVRDILTQVTAFLNDGDATGALAVLDAITDEYLSIWEGLDDSDGEASAFFYDLGPVWTETLLSADLDEAARESWTEKLNGYAADLSDFGVEDIFDTALVAIAEDWDDPAVKRALAGEPEPDDDEVAEARLTPDGDIQLAQARLNVLERQGRIEEFLNLAEATGQRERRATMLVRMGRADEALVYGLDQIRTAEEALGLARTFRERDDPERALRIAELGLTLPTAWDTYTYDDYRFPPPYGRAELAIWTRDLASELGQNDLALRAARIAFEREPSLGAYLRAQEIAGESWDTLQPDLLAHLRDHRSALPAGHVDVFLHEGLIGDAVATVSGASDWGLVARVADAAIESHPDWVTATARRRAAGIMDDGRSSHYGEAVAWLARAGAAERALGRVEAWRAELDDLIARHGRKYKLRPMLEDLQRRT